IKEIEFDPEKTQLYEGKGCEKCRFTGYHGRTAIYEILTITQTIRELILSRASSQQIKQKAISEGMRTLRQDGLRKIILGLTTLSEVVRVTQQEELPEE
ncbi:MAG: type II/IV secretion system protein, partial [Candidatus Omnitrophica bacterium]|nr:type II/IV secretion system protein [Candidatus Omnitrophota bacterium]